MFTQEIIAWAREERLTGPRHRERSHALNGYTLEIDPGAAGIQAKIEKLGNPASTLVEPHKLRLLCECEILDLVEATPSHITLPKFDLDLDEPETLDNLPITRFTKRWSRHWGSRSELPSRLISEHDPNNKSTF